MTFPPRPRTDDAERANQRALETLLAVIGPMRMNYGKVMSVVDFTADTVSQLLAELGGS